MKERVHILKHMYIKKCPIINNKSEIYSSCWHNTKFHRYVKFSTGTDESEIGRKSYDSNRNYYLVSNTTDTQVEEELNFGNYNTQSMESSPYDTNTAYNLLETTKIPPDPKFKKWSTRRNYY